VPYILTRLQQRSSMYYSPLNGWMCLPAVVCLSLESCHEHSVILSGLLLFSVILSSCQDHSLTGHAWPRGPKHLAGPGKGGLAGCCGPALICSWLLGPIKNWRPCQRPTPPADGAAVGCAPAGATLPSPCGCVAQRDCLGTYTYAPNRSLPLSTWPSLDNADSTHVPCGSKAGQSSYHRMKGQVPTILVDNFTK
jgi:hypothetical protein